MSIGLILAIVLVVLLAATVATFEIGERGGAGTAAMAALLTISFIKGRLVVLDFMGLRGVKFFWRGLLLGWLLLVLCAVRAGQSRGWRERLGAGGPPATGTIPTLPPG